MKVHPYIEIKSLEELAVPEGGLIKHCAFQHIDFTEAKMKVLSCTFSDCCFLGCEIPSQMESCLDGTCIVLPRMGMLYKAFANKLYCGETLYAGYDPQREETYDGCFDARVYGDYIEKGKHSEDIRETLSRSLHDHSMSNAMYNLLAGYPERNVVAVMGGHALLRTDPAYRQIVHLSKALTEKGRLMVSGGGPGAMEATHVGAWMAGRSEEELEDALEMLSVAPSFRDAGWIRTAFEVRAKYPQETYNSLGVPTWFYGHEPATPFATHIAKYFDNSIREDGILTIAKGGIIYSPGSAGTMQEIFQDAAQNHYETFGYSSPMVFLGIDYYTRQMPVYPLLQDLMERGRYKNLKLSITDSPDEVVDIILKAF